eukprot:31323-Pelagococcus_subviridis.AAC.15
MRNRDALLTTGSLGTSEVETGRREVRRRLSPSSPPSSPPTPAATSRSRPRRATAPAAGTSSVSGSWRRLRCTTIPATPRLSCRAFETTRES